MTEWLRIAIASGVLLGLVFLPDQLARALGLMGWMLSLYLVTLGGR